MDGEWIAKHSRYLKWRNRRLFLLLYVFRLMDTRQPKLGAPNLEDFDLSHFVSGSVGLCPHLKEKPAVWKGWIGPWVASSTHLQGADIGAVREQMHHCAFCQGRLGWTAISVNNDDDDDDDDVDDVDIGDVVLLFLLVLCKLQISLANPRGWQLPDSNLRMEWYDLTRWPTISVYVPPWKLTYPLKINGWKMYSLLK